MGEVRALTRSYVIKRSRRAIRVEAIATFAVSESLPTMTLIRRDSDRDHEEKPYQRVDNPSNWIAFLGPTIRP